MSKILEYAPTQESVVTSRVLLLVHRAIDEHFPSAVETHRQFTKTVFTSDEKTAANRVIPDVSEAQRNILLRNESPAQPTPQKQTMPTPQDQAAQEFSRLDSRLDTVNREAPEKSNALLWMALVVVVVAVVAVFVFMSR